MADDQCPPDGSKEKVEISSRGPAQDVLVSSVRDAVDDFASAGELCCVEGGEAASFGASSSLAKSLVASVSSGSR
jgi:hypothetical protein